MLVADARAVSDVFRAYIPSDDDHQALSATGHTDAGVAPVDSTRFASLSAPANRMTGPASSDADTEPFRKALEAAAKRTASSVQDNSRVVSVAQASPATNPAMASEQRAIKKAPSFLAVCRMRPPQSDDDAAEANDYFEWNGVGGEVSARARPSDKWQTFDLGAVVSEHDTAQDFFELLAAAVCEAATVDPGSGGNVTVLLLGSSSHTATPHAKLASSTHGNSADDAQLVVLAHKMLSRSNHGAGLQLSLSCLEVDGDSVRDLLTSAERQQQQGQRLDFHFDGAAG